MVASTDITDPRTSLGDVEAVVRRWVGQTDPALLTGVQAAGDVERLATVIRQLTAKQTGLAARAAECNSYSKRSPSPEDWLARQNGTSRSEAKRAIDTARRLKDCPRTAEAFAAGDLSLGEAEAISGAAVLDPRSEGRLVSKASSSHDLSETREQVERVKRAARHGEDPAARPDPPAGSPPLVRVRRRRDEGGRRPVRARGVGAGEPGDRRLLERPVRAGPLRRPPRTARGLPGRRRARRVRRGGRAAGHQEQPHRPHRDTTDPAEPESTDLLKVRPDRIKWNVSVLVDGIALKRGYATATETCEIPGFGPVDVDWVKRILPEAMVDVLVHDLTDIRAHATMTRHRKKALDASLRARDKRCVVPDCRRRRRLEADHRHDFAKLGPTAYDNMELLCQQHHDDKTHRGARIERVGDEWHWYPPTPRPGEPEPPPGSIPWKAPVGQHLTAFDLDDLPEPPDGEDPPDDGTLSFGFAA